MNWQAALTEIESPQFAARLNVVSSAKAFFREVAQDPVVLDLYRQVKDSGELQESTLDRIHDLAGQEIDRRYENPNDTPLAVLLWLTYHAAPDAGPVAAHYVARAPQCWYARKLARWLLEPRQVAAPNFWGGVEAKVRVVNSRASTAPTVSAMLGYEKVRLTPAVSTSAVSPGMARYTVEAAS